MTFTRKWAFGSSCRSGVWLLTRYHWDLMTIKQTLTLITDIKWTTFILRPENDFISSYRSPSFRQLTVGLQHVRASFLWVRAFFHGFFFCAFQPWTPHLRQRSRPTSLWVIWCHYAAAAAWVKLKKKMEGEKGVGLGEFVLAELIQMAGPNKYETITKAAWHLGIFLAPNDFCWCMHPPLQSKHSILIRPVTVDHVAIEKTLMFALKTCLATVSKHELSQTPHNMLDDRSTNVPGRYWGEVHHVYFLGIFF